MGVLNVFVSYRTDDTGDLAERLAERLKSDLGLDAVFFAPSETRTYDDWTTNIERSLEASQVVVALVGPEWTNCGQHDDQHEGCVFDAEDWVGREVAYGLTDSETVVLPVLVGVTRLPDELPIDLDRLSRVQGVGLPSADLDEADYQQVLTACWQGLNKIDETTMIVVTDGSDEAQVDLDKFVVQLEQRDLIDAARLSATVNDPQGLRAIPLRQGAKEWPKVITLEPRTRRDIAAARLTAAARMRGVQTAAIAGSTLAVEKLGVTDLMQETGLEIAQTTTDSIISSVAGSASTETASTGGIAGWWSSAGTATKVATASVGIALVAGGVAATLIAATDDETPSTALELTSVEVSGASSIYQAGLDTPGPTTDPPPEGFAPASLPVASGAVVTFDTSGAVDCCASNTPSTGPDGDPSGRSEVEPFQGISGFSFPATMPLVGVFLDGTVRPEEPPATRRDSGDEVNVEPSLGQVFFIGDGVGSSGTTDFIVPEAATRLYLGIADAWNHDGPPSYYDDNTGTYDVVMTMRTND